ESFDERRGKIVRVETHFALVYERLFRLKDILDGVFDGDDVFHALGVDEVYHRGERGRLALPYRTHHEEEALRLARKARQYFRQIELCHGADLAQDEAKRYRNGTALKIRVASKAIFFVGFVREINLLSGEEFLEIVARDEHFEKALRVFGGENRLF